GNFHQPSTNDCLKNLFQVLTFEKERRLDRSGGGKEGVTHGVTSSVNNLAGIYDILSPFIKRWKKTAKPRKLNHSPCYAHVLSPVYMVTVDVKAAFDTIQHDRLLAIVERLLSEDEYHVRNYVTTAMQNGKLRRLFKKGAGPGDDFLQFPESPIAYHCLWLNTSSSSHCACQFVKNLVRRGLKDTLISDQTR
ncbi:hypothetical protein SARC_10651, partial [Sphaeroforma arctica JP610]